MDRIEDSICALTFSLFERVLSILFILSNPVDSLSTKKYVLDECL
jgi:hypothetical protein